MNISLNWLTDYVDIKLSAAELGDLCTRIGMNLEGIVETDSDIVLDLEVTSNRPDCLGHLGVAREIAAATGAEFRPPVIDELPTSGKVEELTSVEVKDSELCPRYTARVIRGVKVGPSPTWLVEKTETLGMRSVNNIVDITNFVLMEYSQPLHSFDYDKLAENRIVVRRAKGGETMTAIDGTDCRLDKNMLVIADAEKCVAIAGVMGGLGTEVDENTTNILLESAQFDPLNVRHTSRQLQLMSESNFRFERGVDPIGIEIASRRACQLILQLAGGELAEGMVDVWTQPFEAPQVSLRPTRTNALLGIEVDAQKQFEILESLELSPQKLDDKIVCTIPSHRGDLRREADLIEEVARLVGYDEIVMNEKVAHTLTAQSLTERTRKQVGSILTAAGFDETVTFTFVDDEEAKLFGYDKPIKVDQMVRRTNNVIRPSVVPCLVRACKTNQDAGNCGVSLFEMSKVLIAGDKTLEQWQLALATTGELGDLQGAVETVVAGLNPSATVKVTPQTAAGFEAGASAAISINDKPVGVIGCIAGDVQKYYGLERNVAAAELSFDALQDIAGATRTYKPVPKFPAVERDLSLVVDESVSWHELSEQIAAVKQPMRVGVDYVTTYRGKQIDKNRKSVTVALTYRSDTETLRSEQVDEQVAKVVEKMKKKFKAELRS